MRALRFATLLGMTLILGLAFAHVMELPGKLRLAGPDWLTVQHNLYIGFGSFAAVVEPLTILLAWILAIRLRSYGMDYMLALGAALCVTAGLIVWALVVSPVNGALNGWTVASLPTDWPAYRNRWEIGHAIHALLFGAAFCMLAWDNQTSGRRQERDAG
ncbi:MAG: hypothetical protein ACJ8AW_50765 [Rhodopila sp.]